MVPSSTLQEIKDRLSIVSIVGEYVPLKPAGRNHRGLCPFHSEKSPSFMVNEEKQIYHCFGCGEGGDIFRFLMKQEGLSFPEAIRSLADRAGVRLPETPQETRQDDAQHQKKRWALRLNQIVWEHFQANLADPQRGEVARNYLKERGFLEIENNKQHFLGYADDSWDTLVGFLTEKKVPMTLAADLGLVRPRITGDGYYDFFRHRIMFAITNAKGEILGFGGRTFGAPKTAEGQDGDPAKYLNSPDSFLYHKSHSVFGLSVAHATIRRSDEVILVEGYMDAVALHEAGILNTVAPLGTALTTGHVRLLMRYSRNMVVIFDGDEAGQKAARRSWPVFLELGIVPRVVVLPDGEDPDSFIRRHGAETLRGWIEKAATLGEWVIDRTILACGRDTAGQVKAMKVLRPLLQQVQDAVERDAYERRIAQQLGIEVRILRSSRQSDSRRGNADVLESHSIERRVLALALQYPKLWIAFRDAMREWIDEECRTIAQAMEQLPVEGWTVGKVVENLVDKDLCSMIEEMSLSDPECAEEESAAVMQDYLAILQQRRQKESLSELNDQIARAQLEGNEHRLQELLNQKQRVVQSLHSR